MYYKFDVEVMYMLITFALVLIIYVSLSWSTHTFTMTKFLDSYGVYVIQYTLFTTTIMIGTGCYLYNYLNKYGNFYEDNLVKNIGVAKELIKSSEYDLIKNKMFQTTSEFFIIAYIFTCVAFPFLITFMWFAFYIQAFKYSKFKF